MPGLQVQSASTHPGRRVYCKCDCDVIAWAAGDVQASQQALQKVKDAATKQMGISASVSQCAVALADGTMVTEQ